jgi:hypothetical protein
MFQISDLSLTSWHAMCCLFRLCSQPRSAPRAIDEGGDRSVIEQGLGEKSRFEAEGEDLIL